MTIIVRFCVLQIAQRLQLRLRNYLQVLRTNKITVENLYKFHVKQPITQQYDCCSIPCKHFKWVLQSPLSLSPSLLAFSALPLDSFSFFLLPPSPPPTSHHSLVFLCFPLCLRPLPLLLLLSVYLSDSVSFTPFTPPPPPPPRVCVYELSEMLLPQLQ